MISILGAGLLLIAVITCVMLALPALARPTLPFGVRVGPQRTGDPAVIAVRRSYARLTLVTAALAAIVTLLVVPATGSAGSTGSAGPSGAAGSVGSAGSLAVIGVIASALLVANLLLFVRAHRTLRAAKLAGRWGNERRQGVTADTTFRTNPVCVPWKWGLPALAVILITAGIGWALHGALPATLPPFLGYDTDPAQREPTTVLSVFQPVIYQIAVTLVAVAWVLAVLRARPDIDAAQPKGSARRYRVYLRGIAAMSLLSAACLNLSLLIAALPLWQIVTPAAIWRLTMFAPLIVLAGGWLLWELKVGQAGHRLPALPGEEQEDTGLGQRDDDRHWHLAGTIYINRRDPALVVHDRVGSSTWTLNLGHPIAWLLLAALAAALITLAGLALSGAL